MSRATLNVERGHIFDFELCRFRSLRSNSLGELTAWARVGIGLIGVTPGKLSRAAEKESSKNAKKPRLWESWLSLVSAVSSAFWWRGTVRNAPYFQFNGTTSSCRALNNFGKSSRFSPPHGACSWLFFVPACDFGRPLARTHQHLPVKCVSSNDKKRRDAAIDAHRD